MHRCGLLIFANTGNFGVPSCVALSRSLARTQIIIVTLMADSALSVLTLPAACQAPRVDLWVAAANSHRRRRLAFQLHLSLYTGKNVTQKKKKYDTSRRDSAPSEAESGKKICQVGESFDSPRVNVNLSFRHAWINIHTRVGGVMSHSTGNSMPRNVALLPHLPPVCAHFETVVGAPRWKIPINLKPQSIIAILAGSALCSKLAITLLTGSEPPRPLPEPPRQF